MQGNAQLESSFSLGLVLRAPLSRLNRIVQEIESQDDIRLIFVKRSPRQLFIMEDGGGRR